MWARLAYKAYAVLTPPTTLTSSLFKKQNSWTAKDTFIQRPNKITWESTSGMKNRGCVEFVTPETNDNNDTRMKLSFTFVAPRVVSSLFRRSNMLRRYTEDVLLMGMLMDFRDVVLGGEGE